jgi:hypothetical protein
LKDIYLSRRQIVKTLLALGAGGVSLASYWDAFAGDAGLVRMALGAEEKATLEVFTALSRMITLRDNLDAETTRRMYKVFMDEPWGREHVLRLHKKLSAALAAGADRKKLSLKDEKWQLDDGEKWFAGHLLTTWYLGVYYHEKRPKQRVAYETALMFDTIRGIIPVPLVEAAGFGTWTAPPAGLK